MARQGLKAAKRGREAQFQLMVPVWPHGDKSVRKHVILQTPASCRAVPHRALESVGAGGNGVNSGLVPGRLFWS
jgi:hypothetical protein